jgi:hypothetical protein
MAAEEIKLSPEAVDYRPARRDKRCGTCASFVVETSTCAIVAGPIAANMTCSRWTLMPGLYRRDLDPPPRRG